MSDVQLNSYLLGPDHPITTDPDCLCALCRLGFTAGQRVVLVPLSTPPPGTCQTVEALPCHKGCIENSILQRMVDLANDTTTKVQELDALLPDNPARPL